MTNLRGVRNLDISVVIPALNAGKYLPPLIRSIESQSLLPKEIIIVDSSPSNKTGDMLEKWNGSVPIILKKVELAYPGKARNIGVALAKNEWIAFLDCRTIPNQYWLENCVASIQEEQVDFVSALFVCDASTHFQGILRAATYGCSEIKALTGSLVSKKAFQQSGGFENVRAGEDLEWMDRIEKLGFKIISVPTSSVNYQGLQETFIGVLKKSYMYAFANAYLEIRSNQKILYLMFVFSLSLLFVYRLNWSFSMFELWESTNKSGSFLPHVTKIYVVLICVAYVVYRGIIRPLNANVSVSFLLPWRWLEVSFIGVCVDLAKAPGLLWGAWLMLIRRYTGFCHLGQTNVYNSTISNIDVGVVSGFGDEWTIFDRIDIPEYDDAFNDYFHIFPWESIPADAVGFDLGCGSGRWAKYVSKKTRILHCIDPSKEALEVARKNLGKTSSFVFHHAGVDNIPIPNSSADFGYSLGVLHHVPDTFAGLKACVNKLKSGAPFLLYLYYAFDNKPFWYKWLFLLTSPMRKLISNSPLVIRFVVSQVLAILIYWPLSRIAAILERFGIEVDSFPLSYYRNKPMYILRTDALDRFGTQLEKRFTKVEIERMMYSAGLKQVIFSNRSPYWVALGYKV